MRGTFESNESLLSMLYGKRRSELPLDRIGPLAEKRNALHMNIILAACTDPVAYLV